MDNNRCGGGALSPTGGRAAKRSRWPGSRARPSGPAHGRGSMPGAPPRPWSPGQTGSRPRRQAQLDSTWGFGTAPTPRFSPKRAGSPRPRPRAAIGCPPPRLHVCRPAACPSEAGSARTPAAPARAPKAGGGLCTIVFSKAALGVGCDNMHSLRGARRRPIRPPGRPPPGRPRRPGRGRGRRPCRRGPRGAGSRLRLTWRPVRANAGSGTVHDRLRAAAGRQHARWRPPAGPELKGNIARRAPPRNEL